MLKKPSTSFIFHRMPIKFNVCCCHVDRIRKIVACIKRVTWCTYRILTFDKITVEVYSVVLVIIYCKKSKVPLKKIPMYIAQFPPKIRITRMSQRFPQVSNRDPMSPTLNAKGRPKIFNLDNSCLSWTRKTRNTIS